MLDADDVRRIALSFPETVEKQRWGHPTFDVAGRMFVTVPDDHEGVELDGLRFEPVQQGGDRAGRDPRSRRCRAR